LANPNPPPLTQRNALRDCAGLRYHRIRANAQGEPAMTSATLIGVLVTFLVIILVLYLIGMLPIDGRAKQIARVIVIIIGVISLLRYLAVF
jgi:hypothetical protein